MYVRKTEKEVMGCNSERYGGEGVEKDVED